MSNNQLNGTIPSSVGNLKQLQYLYLNNNQLSGEIPSSIGNLKQLFDLELYDNQLSGAIPSSIGKLKFLRSLHLYNNQLSGEIPRSVHKLTLLNSVGIDNNQLTQNSNVDHPVNDQYHRYYYLNGSNNRFTFNGFEFVAKGIQMQFTLRRYLLPFIRTVVSYLFLQEVRSATILTIGSV